MLFLTLLQTCTCMNLQNTLDESMNAQEFEDGDCGYFPQAFYVDFSIDSEFLKFNYSGLMGQERFCRW